MSVKDHYDQHLAHFYEWMTGDFDQHMHAQLEYFQSHALIPDAANQRAIDLGAGHGIHSIALAKLGYHVLAVDFNQHLLSLLDSRSKGLSIETHQQELLTFMKEAPQAKLITCMGDTLPHLQHWEEVHHFFKACKAALKPGGTLVISFRDYSQALEGAARFIPVKADDQRILSCILDYGPTLVSVSDLLYERDQERQWHQKVSTYQKLRLFPAKLEEIAQIQGFKCISQQEIKRLLYWIFTH